MTISTAEPTTTFAYQAQTRQGEGLSGTIDAPTVEDAKRRLESLELRLINIAPAERASKTLALRGDDFIAFNQQLAHLTEAGLPVEHGLRLIAEDMRRGRIAATVRAVADDLDKGLSLAEAFEKHRGRFPSTYGRLIEAGVRTSNLPGMLFGLSRHVEMVHRLRASIWRCTAYPLMVLAAISLVTLFLGWYVIPQFQSMYSGFKVALPQLTLLVFSLARVLPILSIVILSLIVAMPMIWGLLRTAGLDRKATDILVLPIPLIGPVVKRGLLASWCNAMHLAVNAGLDLPAALDLAGSACGSPRVDTDSRALVMWIQSGKTLESASGGRILSATVVAAMSLGIHNHNLAQTLHSLGEMYQQQAEMRLSALPMLLSPLMLLLAAITVGLVLAALLLPMIRLFSAVSGL